MDVRLIGTFIVLTAYGICGYVASQPVESPNNMTSDATECLTAKNVSGHCVPRQRCEYGPGAVDLTLYAPHEYVRPCAMDEVCCPEFAMALVETNISPSMDSDEDDV